MTKEFPFTITEVANLLNLTVRYNKPNALDVDCPFCHSSNHKKGKMNLNKLKSVYRCNYCGESGGMIQLYGKIHGLSNSDAYREICERTNSGQRKPIQYQGTSTNKIIFPMEETKKASPQVIHQTYTMLLSMVSLAKPHKENLFNRGLSIKDMERNLYKSVPAFGQKQICHELLRLGCTLEGVPGFYEEPNGEWNVKLRASGIIIPIFNMDRLITGAQIRLDHPLNDRKYIWLASSDKPKGVSSGALAHFIGNPTDKQVYITEGPLKGTIAHSISGYSFISIPGVNSLSCLDPFLKTLKQLGLKSIIETLDMDKFTNPNVAKAAIKLRRHLADYGFQVKSAIWNKDFNGVDDYYQHRRCEQMRKTQSMDMTPMM